jgi:hypothetical protein
MTTLAKYRTLPHAERNLTNWRAMSEADRAEYLEAGGANAPINNQIAAETVTAIDPIVAATIERVKANHKLATTAAPKDAATSSALDRIAANYKAASGFDLRRKDS